MVDWTWVETVKKGKLAYPLPTSDETFDSPALPAHSLSLSSEMGPPHNPIKAQGR